MVDVSFWFGDVAGQEVRVSGFHPTSSLIDDVAQLEDSLFVLVAGRDCG